MITPRIISLLFFVMVIGTLYVGFGIIFGPYFSFYRLGIGLFYMIFGTLMARISCELIIVIFKIYEQLKKVADQEDSTAE